MDEAAQREVLAQVLTRRSAFIAIEAGNDTVVRLNADERLMQALAHRHIPIRRRNQTRIDRVSEHRGDAGFIHPIRALAGAVARPFGMTFEKALHLGLNLEAAGGVAFQRFAHDGRERVIGDQAAPFTLDLLVLVADGRAGDGIAAFNPRSHFLDYLDAVFFALQLSVRNGDRLMMPAVRRVIEFEVGACHHRAIFIERVAEFPIEARAAGKAFQVIEDHHVTLAAVSFDMLEHAHHAGARHEIVEAGLAIVKDSLDRHAEFRGVTAAKMLLAAAPIALVFLFLAGYAHV